MKAKDYSGDTPAEKWSLATQGQRQAWLAEARMPNSVAYSNWASMPPSNRAKLAGIIGGAIGDSITTDKRAQLHRALDHVLDSRKGRARDIDRWKSEEEISKTLSERQLMQAYADCFKDDPFNKGLNDDDAFKLMRRRLVGRAKDHVLDSRKGRAKDSSGVTIKGITFTDAEVARYPRKVLEWSAKTGREPWSYNGDKPQYPASKQARDAGGKPSYPTTGIDYKGYEIKKFAPENFVIKKAGTVIGYEPTREDAKRLVDRKILR
jgi:hypothetical protein